MPDGQEKIRCPDCGTLLLKKNLRNHYRRRHPGMDPYRRIRDSRKDHERKVSNDRSGPSVAGFLLVGIAVAIVIIASLLVYSFLDSEGEGPPEPRTVWYTAFDGAVINGTFYEADEEGAPMILLVHDIGQNRKVWKDHAGKIRDRGYNVLAIDLRGHGDSRINIKSPEITYDWTEMGPEDLDKITRDIRGAYDWWTGKDQENRSNTDAGRNWAMIGAGRGGLFGLQQAALMAREGMWSAAVLSPTLDCYDLDVQQVFQDYGDIRPVMLSASENDRKGVDAIEAVQEVKEQDDEKNLISVIVDGDDSGVSLMNNDQVTEAMYEMFELGWEMAPDQ